MATTPTEPTQWEVAEVLGRLPGASNATLLGRLADGTLVVYKPVEGESPLWDFALESLAVREVLAHTVSEQAGWHVVPETRWASGPFGPGSAQRWLTEAEDVDQRSLVHPEMDERLWPIAVLDLVTNNADRKLGHVLPSTDGRLWAIDNALTFHPHDKLRTVLWGFAGRRLPDGILEGLVAHLDGIVEHIDAALGSRAGEAFEARVGRLVDRPVHPMPPDDRPPLPWPLW